MALPASRLSQIREVSSSVRRDGRPMRGAVAQFASWLVTLRAALQFPLAPTGCSSVTGPLPDASIVLPACRFGVRQFFDGSRRMSETNRTPQTSPVDVLVAQLPEPH